MKLTNMELIDFAKKLASNEPAPGGGSAAAYTSAMGAGLVAMVARLTLGKKKYAEHDELMKVIIEEATIQQEKLLLCVDKDTEAYNQVTNVLKMPKETQDEKAARSEAMQKALKSATEVPLVVMLLSLDALKTTHKAIGKSNQSAITDLGVAALNLGAGLKGAWFNALINLSGLKDDKFLDECMKKGTALDMEGEQLSQQIHESVLKSVM